MVRHTMVHHTMLRHTVRVAFVGQGCISNYKQRVQCRSIQGCAALQQQASLRCVATGLMYQSEVADFDEEKIGEEDILRLQIPVQHAVRVKEACGAAVSRNVARCYI